MTNTTNIGKLIQKINKQKEQAIKQAHQHYLINNQTMYFAHPTIEGMYCDVNGNIFGKRGIRKQSEKPNGYRYINYIKNGDRINVYSHRFIIECLTGIILPTNIQIDHIYANTSDNSALSLRACTSSENMRFKTEFKLELQIAA